MCIIEPKGSGNDKDLDKMDVKLFPNFTRHHLITHTKDNEIVDLIMHPDKTSQPFQPFLPCLGDDKETEVLPDELYRIKCDTKMNVQST